MRLYYSAGSPFARMVRMALLETGITIPLVETTLRDPSSTLLPINPVGRVPTLWLRDGVALTETLLILPFLDRLHSGANLMPFEPERLAALGRVMGLLEGIAVWNRELRRPEDERSLGLLALEATRANRVADALERDLTLFDRIDAGWLALTAALGYCERRHTIWRWRDRRPALAGWFDTDSEQPAEGSTSTPTGITNPPLVLTQEMFYRGWQ